MKTLEVNFDGLVGPTHNYAGLSLGNVASLANMASVAHPRKAALQGLQKMRLLRRMGYAQAILPPLERPAVRWLRHFGFSDSSDAAVIRRAAREAPSILVAASSASAMWTANAATVTPSVDSTDGRLHLTPANLAAKLHRSIEAEETAAVLRRIFGDPAHFAVHRPLGGGIAMGDEGAANHTRFAAEYGERGFHLFVYGRVAQSPTAPAPVRFPARQTLEACEAIARRHGIPSAQVAFLQQNPDVIDAGVFHNDVIAVGNLDTLLFHEQAFVGGRAAIQALAGAVESAIGRPLRLLEVATAEVSVADAVKAYLFNSQLLSHPEGGVRLIAPEECRETPSVAAWLERAVADPDMALREVCYLDLRESMRNGGGPACLRQRVVLREDEIAALGARVLLDDTLADEIEAWIRCHYRETLTAADLGDPDLLEESRRALDELTQILRLGSLYGFQRDRSSLPQG
jgi:succinylarginine dihydrolase